MTGLASLSTASSVVDAWTNVLLLGLTMTALGLRQRSRILHDLALAASIIGVLASSWAYLVGGWPWTTPVVEAPLLGAMVLNGLYLARRSVGPTTEDRGWFLASAILGMRFAELASSVFLKGLLHRPFAATAEALVSDAERSFAFLFLIAAFVMLVKRARTADGEERAFVEAGIGLLLAGFLVGVARVDAASVQSLIFFTLGFARPIAFLLIQDQLDGTQALRSVRSRMALAGGVIFVAGTAGLALSSSFWDLPPWADLAMAGGLALWAFPFASRWAGQARAREAPTGLASPSVPPRTWGLDSEKASLPPNWEQMVSGNYEAYLAAPEGVRRHLRDLTRWQRILLALNAVPDDQPRAYDRSTPGLHLSTHCPYASIGPEVHRTNARYQAVLDDLEIDAPKLPTGKDSLIQTTSGRAEGLRSHRASLYRLTPLGRKVAAKLSDRLDWAGADESRIARCLGEEFPKQPDAIPPLPQNAS
jgi:hypothetical protein